MTNTEKSTIAYIEIVGDIGVRRHILNEGELREIGRFISGNVRMWLDNHKGLDWLEFAPVEDFHAVCGDIDIPWTTEEAKRLYHNAMSLSKLRELGERDALAGKPKEAFYDIPNIEHSEAAREQFVARKPAYIADGEHVRQRCVGAYSSATTQGPSTPPSLALRLRSG